MKRHNMKINPLICPQCRANLEIDGERTVCCCQYCGCKIVIENEKQEYTINKNININKSIQNRYTNDADVIRAKSEADKDMRDFKQVLIIWGVIIAIALAVIFGGHIYKSVSQRRGMVNAGYYEDLLGKDYETVKAHFEAAGFTNIELIDLDNSGIAFWNNGKVNSVSVGGDMDFDSMDWFAPDTKVVISYH